MSYFQQGQKVRANASVQGMQRGAEYLVAWVTPGLFGTVTYTLVAAVGASTAFAVGNLHLLASAVEG